MLRFLFSPYGFPMIGAAVIEFIELINDRIRAIYDNFVVVERKEEWRK